jgi:hypothetical protein
MTLDRRRRRRFSGRTPRNTSEGSRFQPSKKNLFLSAEEDGHLPGVLLVASCVWVLAEEQKNRTDLGRAPWLLRRDINNLLLLPPPSGKKGVWGRKTPASG